MEVRQPASAVGTPRTLSQRAHRQLIGVLGAALPFLLYVVAGVRHTDGLPSWALLSSVSAYYYTGAVGIFVGVLFALSLFLLTYPGYDDEGWDRFIGKVGGAAALCVALVPTGAPIPVAAPTWWQKWMSPVHYAAATLLFVSFILFSIWLFRKSSVPVKQNRPLEKQRRDRIFLWCGIVMIGAVVSAAVCSWMGVDIFVPEAIAIVAFAISWLVKGEARRSWSNAVRRALTRVRAN